MIRFFLGERMLDIEEMHFPTSHMQWITCPTVLYKRGVNVPNVYSHDPLINGSSMACDEQDGRISPSSTHKEEVSYKQDTPMQATRGVRDEINSRQQGYPK